MRRAKRSRPDRLLSNWPIPSTARLSLVSQLVQHNGYIVGNESITLRETVFLQHYNLPTGGVEVDAIQEGSLDKGGGDGLKQVGALQHIRDTILRVTHETIETLAA